GRVAEPVVISQSRRSFSAASESADMWGSCAASACGMDAQKRSGPRGRAEGREFARGGRVFEGPSGYAMRNQTSPSFPPLGAWVEMVNLELMASSACCA